MESTRSTAAVHPKARPALIGVLLAERNDHYRETLRHVLSHYPACQVLGEAATLREAVAAAKRLNPNMVLLDFDLVINQSSARLRKLAQAFPHLQVVVLLSDYSQDYQQAVQERWGYPCIAKDRVEEHLSRILAGLT